jgi:hypothetical protein
MPITCHLCASDIRLRTLFTKYEYIFENFGLKYSNLKRGYSEFWIMHGRHGSRTWYLDIALIRHTCMIASFQWTPVLLLSIYAYKLKLMVACYNSIYQGVLSFFLCEYIYMCVWMLDINHIHIRKCQFVTLSNICYLFYYIERSLLLFYNVRNNLLHFWFFSFFFFNFFFNHILIL